MIYLLGGIVVAFALLMAWGAITGRVKVRSCCAVDPRRDLRMRGAFPDQDTPCPPAAVSSPPPPWLK